MITPYYCTWCHYVTDHCRCDDSIHRRAIGPFFCMRCFRIKEDKLTPPPVFTATAKAEVKL